MMASSYVPLRAHSEYSLVAGLGSISALVAQAKALNFTALTLSDESNCFAAIKFYRECVAAKIKPIFAADLLLKTDTAPVRFTLLCQNEQGYRSLTQLISYAYLNGERFQGLPLIEKSWLSEASCQGLIALSGGVQGEIARALLKENHQAAEALLMDWLRVFNEDRFYLEVFRVGLPEEEAYIEQVRILAHKMDLPIVATQPSFFLKADDFMVHEVRCAIHDGFSLEDPTRPKNFTEQQYLMSGAEMAERFQDLPEALANNAELAKRCNMHFALGQVFLPNFPIPEALSEVDYFRKAARLGLTERLKIILAGLETEVLQKEKQQNYLERLELELEVIIKMGFSGYFLIVADFIQWSKNNGVPVGPGRGSGAGSLVAYALKITDIDPLPYDLLFERFLNPERVSLPDFDVDFCMEGRDRVIEYVAEKYGRQAVSQIITFGSMAAKAVVRDVGRASALPYGFVDGIAKLIPLDLGMTLAEALTQEPQLKKRYEAEDDVKNLIDMALRLEGTVRNVGKHAGGVVIAPKDLTEFTPIYCEEGSQQIVTQYDKDDVESIGLVKFDFLGLRNLTIIQESLNTIHQLQDLDAPLFDINLIPLNDSKTYDLLKKGETTAVFQLESRGMKELIKRLKPDCFEDIIALVALFRPGPLQSGMVDDFIERKHGHAKIVYPHPLAAPILKPTYGIILYQEQVMLIAQVLGNYTLGAADLLRRAMGKKKPEEMAKQRSIFVQGAAQNQIDEATASGIFDLMEKFAGYGFNKSHSAAYALLAYQTAYLKAHYPAAFMAAVLSSDMDNTDKLVGFVDECKAMHLNIFPPDIQASAYHFKMVDAHSIRYGFGAIKGVGQAAIEALLLERKVGAFKDLFDLCQRIDLRKINKRVLEALIMSGALDQLGPNRATMMASLEAAMQHADQHERASAQGQHDLFGLGSSAPEVTHEHWHIVEDYVIYDRVMKEKQVLGWCLSGHPLDDYRQLFKALHLCPIAELRTTGRNDTLKLAGIVSEVRRIKTKKGSFLLVLKIEDFSHKIELTCFSDVAHEYQELLKPEALLVVDAEVAVDDFNGNLRAVARSVHDLHAYQSMQAKCVRVTVTTAQMIHGAGRELADIFRIHKGSCPVQLIYQSTEAEVSLQLDPAWSVALTPALNDALRAYAYEVIFE